MQQNEILSEDFLILRWAGGFRAEAEQGESRSVTAPVGGIVESDLYVC